MNDLRDSCGKCDSIKRTKDASGKCHKHVDGTWSCGELHDGPGWDGRERVLVTKDQVKDDGSWLSHVTRVCLAALMVGFVVHLLLGWFT